MDKCEQVILSLINISLKRENTNKYIMKNINLSICNKEKISIIGSSGSGKTTLAKIIASIIPYSSGNIKIKNANNKHNKGISLILENIEESILPWLSIGDNIKMYVNESHNNKEQLVLDIMCKIGLAGLEEARPVKYSGLHVRMALARGLISEPDIIIIDNIFANRLDCLTAGTIKNDLQQIINKTNTAMILFTSNIEEAIVLTDKIIIIGECQDGATSIKHIFDVSFLKNKDVNSKTIKKLTNQIYTTFVDVGKTDHSFAMINDALGMLECIKILCKNTLSIHVSELAEYTELDTDFDKFIDITHTLKKLGIINIVQGDIFLTNIGNLLVKSQDIQERKNIIKSALTNLIPDININGQLSIRFLKNTLKKWNKTDITGFLSWAMYCDLTKYKK